MEEPKQEAHLVFLQNAIIDDAKRHVLALFNQHQSTGFFVHNYSMVDKMDRTISQIVMNSTLEKVEVEAVRLAAIFYPLGYMIDRKQSVEKSQQALRTFLQRKKCPASFIHKVESLLHAIKGQPHNQDTQLLSDAYTFCLWGEEFKDTIQLLRLEKEFLDKNKIKDEEWFNNLLKKALDINYYLDYSKIHFEPILGKNILYLKKQINQLSKIPAKKTGKFQIEEGSTIRSVQTFFRSAFRVHINLSAIADNKANIMISVNAIILSVMVTVLSYRNIPETNPAIMAPLLLLLLSGLASLTFAVLSSRPRVTSLNRGKVDLAQIKQNMTFFGNFSVLEIEEFEELMDEMLQDNELLFSNMVRDLYYLGKVLETKYKFLTFSYNIFMIGFAVSIVLFFIVYFIQ